MVRRRAADGEGLPARHQRPGPLVRVVLAGTPEVALPSLEALAASDHDARRRRDPARRPRGPGPPPGRQPGRPAGRGARPARPQARPPARPRLPGRPPWARARLLPGRGLRRAAARLRARHPAPRLGQPALLVPAGLAGCGARPARAAGRRRGHGGDHLPDRPGHGRGPDLRHDDRAHPAPRHRRRPAGAPGRGRGRPAGRHARRDRRRLAGRARAAHRGRQLRPQGRRSRTPGSTGRCPPASSTATSARARPRRAPGRPGGGAVQARARRARHRRRARPPCRPARVEVRRTEVLVGTGSEPVRLGRVKPFGKKEMAAADWARGVAVPGRGAGRRGERG